MKLKGTLKATFRSNFEKVTLTGNLAGGTNRAQVREPTVRMRLQVGEPTGTNAIAAPLDIE